MPAVGTSVPTYTLIAADGNPYRSTTPGALGGHRKNKVYGRLDCAGAARWIAKGHYVSQRVFFADEGTAAAAGYRPCAGCLPDRYKQWKAGTLRVRITPKPPFDSAAVLAFLAARAIPGLESADGDTFTRGDITLTFLDAAVEVPHAHAATARRVIDADADPAALKAALGDDPILGPLITQRPGLRSPGAFDPYEIAVRAIVGQAISVKAATTILARLAEHGLFPQRDQLANADPTTLPMPETRARALVALAQGTALDEIKGVGPWTRGYVAMRTGDPDVLLDTDLIVRRTIERLGGDIRGAGENWSPYRSYATHHLWAAAQNSPS